jgi:hypothetical protein
MGEEFCKALEEAMKDGAKLEDPDADSRSAGKKPKRPASNRKKKNIEALKAERISKRTVTKRKPSLSRKLAEELR